MVSRSSWNRPSSEELSLDFHFFGVEMSSNDWIKNHVQLVAFGASGCGMISTLFHHAVGWAASYAGVVHAKVSPHHTVLPWTR